MTSQKQRILICSGVACISTGASGLRKQFIERLEGQNLTDQFDVIMTGCHGFCEQGPIVIIDQDGTCYCQVKDSDIEEIVQFHLIDQQPVERLLYLNPVDQKRVRQYDQINFYKKQQRHVLRLCGKINPESIEEYLANGGYQALARCFALEPSQIIEEVKVSKLRGRGGGGFSTGLKWESAKQSVSNQKYIICNADEGDPGAFMDRSILEGNPHSVIEGILIAGYAIGANVGYVYVRSEYPLAVKRLQIAIDQARSYGYLDREIGGSGFSFEIHIQEGAGVFICGEETALIQSIEGNRGVPKPRPPYPTIKGLWGKPTCINNVETLANIPLIIKYGGKSYAKIGTENSTGTKIFALTGKVKNTGLVEVPMGISLREMIFDIGGGIKDDRSFKAVQVGGPSGGCLPETMLDLRLDYDSLLEAGAMMGSGDLVVMDDSICMVNMAKFISQFTQNESCGKCTPCREGTKRMLEILERITEGNGRDGDIELLEQLSQTMIDTSLCGLGQTAPNPVLSTLQYFRHEYEQHIYQKKCSSGVCQQLLSYFVIEQACKACTICARNCPTNAIAGERGQVHKIRQELCIKCGVCYQRCPFKAISFN